MSPYTHPYADGLKETIARLERELEEARERIVQLEKGYDEQRDLATASLEEARQERDRLRDEVQAGAGWVPREVHEARIQALEAALRLAVDGDGRHVVTVSHPAECGPDGPCDVRDKPRAALQPTTEPADPPPS